MYHRGFKAAHIARTGQRNWWKILYLKSEFAFLEKECKPVAEACDKLSLFD